VALVYAVNHCEGGINLKDALRRSGIVLPISSLPNNYGIGTLGASAYLFVDFLQQAGQSYWQILPLSPTGFGDSPYQSCSSRAGNPYFIDLELLEKEGLLEPNDYRFTNFGQHPDSIDYSQIYLERTNVLKKAFVNGRDRYAKKIDAFREANTDWLPDYALFMAIKQHFGMVSLAQWPDSAALRREPDALETYSNLLAQDILFYEFVQMLFFEQWAALKTYANEHGISIIGDVPIYVAEDSVEVWAQSDMFLLAAPGKPSKVAGVPPDFYSETGQLWGNPLYNWKAHKKDGYRWWIDRLKHNAQFFDVIRIDHFRGFYNFWSVEAGEPTALTGKWEKGPGMDFINAIKAALPDTGFIAEDLGDLDEDVIAFFLKTGLPGMSVALYGFDPEGDNIYLGHNVSRTRVAYTSTHDSPTFVEWFNDEAGPEQRNFARDYLRANDQEGIGWCVLKAVWSTRAFLAMAPMQDVLGLGGDSRINTPSTLGGQNWRWRIREEALNSTVAGILRHVTQTYRRLPTAKKEEEIAPTPKKR
jgi:4-alpha-glucanotransferase